MLEKYLLMLAIALVNVPVDYSSETEAQLQETFKINLNKELQVILCLG